MTDVSLNGQKAEVMMEKEGLCHLRQFSVTSLVFYNFSRLDKWKSTDTLVQRLDYFGCKRSR